MPGILMTMSKPPEIYITDMAKDGSWKEKITKAQDARKMNTGLPFLGDKNLADLMPAIM